MNVCKRQCLFLCHFVLCLQLKRKIKVAVGSPDFQESYPPNAGRSLRVTQRTSSVMEGPWASRYPGPAWMEQTMWELPPLSPRWLFTSPQSWDCHGFPSVLCHAVAGVSVREREWGEERGADFIKRLSPGVSHVTHWPWWLVMGRQWFWLIPEPLFVCWHGEAWEQVI